MGALLSCLTADADVEERYVPVKRVGSGAEAEVWLARERASGNLFALKLVKRGMAAWQSDAFAREVQCSLLLGATHVNVVRPHELLLTRKHAILVTSYEAGGTLAAYCKKHRVDEPTACYFFRQLVAALAHCHAQNIAFRDVKLDNILLDGATPPALRLCDFGVARRWAATPGGGAGNKHFSTLAGTPGFLSPQVLGVLFSRGGGGYDGAAADVWSAGVVLAVMLLHRLPFSYDDVAAALDGPSALRTAWEQELRTRWRAGDPELAAALSPPALDLLDRMLEPDEGARITLAEVAKHPWVAQPLPAPLEEALQRQAAVQAGACCDASCADLGATDAAIAEIAQLGRKVGTTPGVERVLSLVPDACRRRSLDSVSMRRLVEMGAVSVGPRVSAGAEAEAVTPAWTTPAGDAGCCAPQGAEAGCAAACAPEAERADAKAGSVPAREAPAESGGEAGCSRAAAAVAVETPPLAAADAAEPAAAVAEPAAAADKPAANGAAPAPAGRGTGILRKGTAAAAPRAAPPAKRAA